MTGLDRWFVSGALAVNTAFDEPTDVSDPLSVSWATVGSAICHEGGDTLNLLETGPAAVQKGPALNWWALDGSSPRKAAHLAAVSAGFGSSDDGKSSGYLSVSTRSPGGGLVEALRVTEHQGLSIAKSVSIGPVSVGPAVGRVETSGPSAGYAFAKRTLTERPATPSAGDRFTWYNPDGSARLWTEGPGDLLTIRSNGDTTFSGAVSVPSVIQWAYRGLNAPPTAWMGYRADMPDSVTLENHIGNVHIAGSHSLYLMNRSGVIVGTGWGGTGDLTVQGNLKVDGQLDVSANHTHAYIRAHDLWFGHSTRRGQPGRALVDLGNALVVNHDADWSAVRVQGAFTVIGPVDDNRAKELLQGVPNHSVIMAVEPRPQGNGVVFYWKDSGGVRRKGAVQGGGF